MFTRTEANPPPAQRYSPALRSRVSPARAVCSRSGRWRRSPRIRRGSPLSRAARSPASLRLTASWGALLSGLHIPHAGPGAGKTALALQIAASCEAPAGGSQRRVCCPLAGCADKPVDGAHRSLELEPATGWWRWRRSSRWWSSATGCSSPPRWWWTCSDAASRSRMSHVAAATTGRREAGRMAGSRSVRPSTPPSPRRSRRHGSRGQMSFCLLSRRILWDITGHRRPSEPSRFRPGSHKPTAARPAAG